MIRILPLSQSESNYEILITLEDVDYILRFLWSERDHHWYMTISDSSGSAIITGVKVVCDAPLASHVTDERIWPGQLWCVDMTRYGVDPGLRDLGTRTKLIYIDQEHIV